MTTPTAASPAAQPSHHPTRHELADWIAARLYGTVPREDVLAISHLTANLVLLDTHARVEHVKRLYHPFSPQHMASQPNSPGDQASKKKPKKRTKKAKDLSSGWSSVTPSDDPGLASLRNALRDLGSRSGFTSITQDDLLVAMRENQVFEVELQVDWDQYEDVPVILARNRRTEVTEGRFIREKLPGYILRGSLGVLFIGLVMLALHFVLSSVILPRGVISQVVSGPGVEHAQTLGPGQRDEFRLDHGLMAGESIGWEILSPDASGTPMPVASFPNQSRGSTFQPADPNRIGYQAPTTVPAEGFDLVVRWRLTGPQGTHQRDSQYRVLAEAEPLPIGSPLRTLSTVFLILGIGGVLAGACNSLRPLLRKLRKAPPSESTPPSKRVGIPKAERFIDLFRKESLNREILGEVLVACKTRESPHYVLALYRDIPLADLETVLPSTRPRVRLLDGLMFVAQIGYGVLLFLFRLVIILAATVVSFGLGAVIALFNAGGLATRSWTRFRTTVKHLATAVDLALFRSTLGSSSEVIHALGDRAQSRRLKSLLSLWASLVLEKSRRSEPIRHSDLLALVRSEMHQDCTTEELSELVRIGLATDSEEHGLVPVLPPHAQQTLSQKLVAAATQL